MTKPIRLLIVDDDPNVRRGLRMRLLLADDIAVVGEAGDGEAAVNTTSALQPDVVLLDIKMPGMDGITACARIRELVAASRVVMLSLHDDEITRERCHAAGAAAFVCKQDAARALLPAIRMAAAELPVSIPITAPVIEPKQPSA